MPQFLQHFTQNLGTPGFTYIPEGLDWVRFWDNEVYWSRIHQGPDTYWWDHMDNLVNMYHNLGIKIIYCFGGTPNWLSTLKDVPNDHHPWMGNGSHGMPTNLDEWNKFCYAVADRYKGKIQAYEMWNEPQLLGYMSPWDQTTRDTMAKMCKRGARTINSVDPSAVVLGPNIFVGNDGRKNRATKIAEAMAGTQGPFGPWEHIEAMACHIYPDTGQGASEWRRQLDENISIVRGLGGPSKMWITETNYNLLGPVLPENSTTEKLIQDTYDAAGGKFVIWYAYNRHADLGGLDMRDGRVAHNKMVEICTGQTYPPNVQMSYTSTDTGWSGYEPSDSITVTYTLKNDSSQAISVSHSEAGLSPSGNTLINAGATQNYSKTYTSNPPSNRATVTFTGTINHSTGLLQSTLDAGRNLPDKPLPPAEKPISIAVADISEDWTGHEPTDTLTVKFRVTNTSEEDTLVLSSITTPNIGLSSGTIAPNEVFVMEAEINDYEGEIDVTIKGTSTSNSSRGVEWAGQVSVTAKPTPPPPITQEGADGVWVLNNGTWEHIADLTSESVTP
jgi:hypothetical protein